MKNKINLLFTIASMTCGISAHANLLCNKMMEANAVTTLEIRDLDDGSQHVQTNVMGSMQNYLLNLSDETSDEGKLVDTYEVQNLKGVSLTVTASSIEHFGQCGRAGCPPPSMDFSKPSLAVWTDAHGPVKFACHEKTQN
jgi:hypothetical protein